MTSREVQQLRAEMDRKIAALRRELMAVRRAGTRRAERLEVAEAAVEALAEAVPVERPAPAQRV